MVRNMQPVQKSQTPSAILSESASKLCWPLKHFRHHSRDGYPSFISDSTLNHRWQRLMTFVKPLLSPMVWQEIEDYIASGTQPMPIQIFQSNILSLDLVGFTEFTEKYCLSQVIDSLNVYMANMAQIVHHRQGEIHKFVGDGFLAVFAQADDAFQAGQALRRATVAFSIDQVTQAGPSFSARIGIDTGVVALVSLGSEERQDRTLLGSPVNLANRLQETAPVNRIRLSQTTFNKLSDGAGFRCIGPVVMKGYQAPVVVYEYA